MAGRGEGKGPGVDLQRSASVTANGGDPRITATLNQLLAAAKQPPRTRVRLAIEDIYYLLDAAKAVFKSRSPLVEIEVRFFLLSGGVFVMCWIFPFLGPWGSPRVTCPPPRLGRSAARLPIACIVPLSKHHLPPHGPTYPLQ